MDAKKTVIRISIWLIVAAVLSALLAWREAVVFQGDFGIFRIVSDGCFIGGLIVCCIGGFAFAGRNGAFDLFSYSMGRIAHSLRHRDGVKEKHQGYFDYVEEKRKGEKKPVWHIFAVGLFFVLLGVVAGFFVQQ